MLTVLTNDIKVSTHLFLSWLLIFGHVQGELRCRLARRRQVNFCGFLSRYFFILKDCVDGFYNSTCTAKCGRCKYNEYCNKQSGHCPRNCTGNFKPPLCQGTVNTFLKNYLSPLFTLKTYDKFDMILGNIIFLCIPRIV